MNTFVCFLILIKCVRTTTLFAAFLNNVLEFPHGRQEDAYDYNAHIISPSIVSDEEFEPFGKIASLQDEDGVKEKAAHLDSPFQSTQTIESIEEQLMEVTVQTRDNVPEKETFEKNRFDAVETLQVACKESKIICKTGKDAQNQEPLSDKMTERKKESHDEPSKKSSPIFSDLFIQTKIDGCSIVPASAKKQKMPLPSNDEEFTAKSPKPWQPICLTPSKPHYTGQIFTGPQKIGISGILFGHNRCHISTDERLFGQYKYFGVEFTRDLFRILSGLRKMNFKKMVKKPSDGYNEKDIDEMVGDGITEGGLVGFFVDDKLWVQFAGPHYRVFLFSNSQPVIELQSKTVTIVKENDFLFLVPHGITDTMINICLGTRGKFREVLDCIIFTFHIMFKRRAEAAILLIK